MKPHKKFDTQDTFTVEITFDDFKKLLPTNKHTEEEAQAIFYYYNHLSLAYDEYSTLEDIDAWAFAPSFTEFYERFWEYLPFEDWCFAKGINPQETTIEQEDLFQEAFYKKVNEFAEYTENGGWVYFDDIPPSEKRERKDFKDYSTYPKTTVPCQALGYLIFSGHSPENKPFAKFRTRHITVANRTHFSYVTVDSHAHIPKGYKETHAFASDLSVYDSMQRIAYFDGKTIIVYCYDNDLFVIQVVK